MAFLFASEQNAMKFGMIGAGTVSQAIAGHVVRAGHDVVFSNSRGPQTLGAVADAFGPHASAGTVAEAGAADFVVLAVHWTEVRDAVRKLPAHEGRIVIDATNQWASLTPAFVAEHLETGGSELVASLIPGAHVIKAFDNMYGRYMAADPVTAAGRRILFYAGDDADSKKLFHTVVEDFGYAPVDLGPLRLGRLMEVDGGPLSGTARDPGRLKSLIGRPGERRVPWSQPCSTSWPLKPTVSRCLRP